MARKTNPKHKKQDLIIMILDWTLNGLSSAEIKKNFFDLGYKSSYFYECNAEAKPLIAAALKDIAKDKLEETIVVMEEQYRQALIESDRKLAHEIRKEINKISNLHSQKIDVTSQGDKIENITVIKIKEITKNDENEEA